MTRFIGTFLRPAVITNVDLETGLLNTKWLDNAGEIGPDVPIPHPYAGKGGQGVFVAPSEGNIILLNRASHERYVPVSVLPHRAFYSDDITGIDETSIDDIAFPDLEVGDVALQGFTGATVFLASDGDLTLQNEFGEGVIFGGDTDELYRSTIYTASPKNYTIGSGFIKSSGVVRRDARLNDQDEDYTNFLTDPTSEQVLETIGWDPSKAISIINKSINDTSDQKLFRNPPFIESKEIIYEFDRDFVVGNKDEEIKLIDQGEIPIRISDDRREKRFNSFSLTAQEPNELMEIIKGTAVDIFGNLLDLNRQISTIFKKLNYYIPKTKVAISTPI